VARLKAGGPAGQRGSMFAQSISALFASELLITASGGTKACVLNRVGPQPTSLFSEVM